MERHIGSVAVRALQPAVALGGKEQRGMAMRFPLLAQEQQTGVSPGYCRIRLEPPMLAERIGRMARKLQSAVSRGDLSRHEPGRPARSRSSRMIEDRQRFLETLGEACAKTGWQVHALLPDAESFSSGGGDAAGESGGRA
ncbi:MAG: hypothetical protein MZV70_77545 [Desulfobacterales bacterium]|nr:hypothetical protein [Desulfobacterales bacterium]